MGIVERVLAEFELSDGTDYRIEHNEGDIVHVHVDSMRIDLTVAEFQEFAAVIERGHEQLRRDKSLDESD